MAHAVCGAFNRMVSSHWVPVAGNEVEGGWSDRGKDQHLARGERGLV